MWLLLICEFMTWLLLICEFMTRPYHLANLCIVPKSEQPSHGIVRHSHGCYWFTPPMTTPTGRIWLVMACEICTDLVMIMLHSREVQLWMVNFSLRLRSSARIMNTCPYTFLNAWTSMCKLSTQSTVPTFFAFLHQYPASELGLSVMTSPLAVTVQGGLFWPLCRGLNIESPAEWPKSGKESG